MEQSRPYSSIRIATKSGPLAQIWLAANMSNLPKISVLQTSISESANEIAKASGCDTNDSENLEHITLHTSGDLLQGIVRVYSKQAAFLLTDIKDTLMRISSLFRANQRINVTINKANTITSIEQLILQDAVTEREVLATPSLDFLEDKEISEGLMGRENSMQRRVQGAAPWDTSLEVGRRFNPDADLEFHQSSALDLDFDFENDQVPSSPKTWEEGTRQTVNGDISSERNGGEPGQLIELDDFPIDDPNNDGWDLGITERNDQESQSETHSNESIEIGRRVEDASMVDEIVDLGIDLGIEKEPVDARSIVEDRPDNTVPLPKQLRGSSGLVNARRIDIDEETELNDLQVKKGVINSPEALGLRKEEPSLTRKRILEELANSMRYLPHAVFDNVISFQQLKKRKTSLVEEEQSSEPQMDLSLGLGDDLLSRDDTGMNSGEDSEDSDHFMPIDADIGLPQAVQDNETSGHDSVRESQQRLNDTEQLSSQQTQKVRLSTGETVSKGTVHLAELLRTEFIDSDSVSFKDVLAVRHREEATRSDKSISKKEASKAFFDLLSLATEDCVDLDQQVAFETINITSRAPLYEKFITA